MSETICSMCHHGIDVEKMWVCCDTRHCPHILNCSKCGLRKLKAQRRAAGRCQVCGINPADLPSRMCPGCEAHAEHTAPYDLPHPGEPR